MHGFELAIEDAADDLELQLDVAQILVRIVAEIVLLDDRIVILEAYLLGETAGRLSAGEQDEVAVSLDERRWLRGLILGKNELCLLQDHALDNLCVASLADGACTAKADAMPLGDDPSKLIEAADAFLGGCCLVARPGERARDAKLVADLDDGDRTAAPPLLIRIAHWVALRLVLAHGERVGEDGGAAHVEDGDHPELVLASHV